MSEKKEKPSDLQLFVGETEQAIEAAFKATPLVRIQNWQLLGVAKFKLDEELTKRELELQSTDNTATYKKKYDELVEYRKKFTSFLDIAKEQCMKVEKRCDPKTNERFLAMVKADLDARIKEQAESDKRAAAAAEFSAFKAHFSNALATQAMDYEIECRNTVNKQYALALEERPENIDAYIQGVVEMLKTIKKPPLPKFERKHVGDEAAKTMYTELVNEAPKPFDWNEYLHEKFSMYYNDIENAAVIIEADRVENERIEREKKDQLEQQVATTNLVARAATYAAPEVLVKTKTSIKIKDDDQKFVVAILSAFLSNFQQAFPLVRVKKYSALTIAQMASALDAAEIKLTNVEYETIKK
jgi:hypothetical protein